MYGSLLVVLSDQFKVLLLFLSFPMLFLTPKLEIILILIKSKNIIGTLT